MTEEDANALSSPEGGIPDVDHIEKVLESFRLAPSEAGYLRMESMPWRKRAGWGPLGFPQGFEISIGKVFLIVLIAILAAGLLTPQGRSLAQTILGYFSRTDSETFPLKGNYWTAELVKAAMPPLVRAERAQASQAEFDLPVSAECEEPAIALSYYCMVNAAERVAGFDLKEFPADPPDSEFSHVQVDLIENHARIIYEGNAAVLLTQGIGDFPPDSQWEQVLADRVQIVRVGNISGEYVQGSFVGSMIFDQARWRDSEGSGRLRWREGERWFEVSAHTLLGDQPAREAIVDLAESLVYQPPMDEQLRPRPGHLNSIAQARMVAGFEPQVPSLLPLGTRFDFAEYDPDWNLLRLVYNGPIRFILIESGDKSSPVTDLTRLSPEEIVEVNGIEAKYRENPSTIVAWEAEGLVYKIVFESEIEKQPALQIAESIGRQDYAPEAKPSEMIARYEVLYGFKTKQLDEVPAQFHLGRVSGWQYGIDLMYKTGDGKARLSLQQSWEEEALLEAWWSQYPPEIVERVRIGEYAGEYVQGHFGAGGKWRADKPFQSLRWQDGERWYLLILEGSTDATKDIDKKRMVELAGSIR